MANSKLQTLQGQFGDPSNKGPNSDEFKKKGGLHMKCEVQLGTCKKYHSVYLGLKKKLSGRPVSEPSGPTDSQSACSPANKFK